MPSHIFVIAIVVDKFQASEFLHKTNNIFPGIKYVIFYRAAAITKRYIKDSTDV